MIKIDPNLFAICAMALIVTACDSKGVAPSKNSSSTSGPNEKCDLSSTCTRPSDLIVSTLNLSNYEIGGLGTDGTYLYSGANFLQKIDVVSQTVTTIAGNPASGYAEGTGSAARFATFSGTDFSEGHLYFADFFNHVVRRINLSTFATALVAGEPLTRGSKDYDGGPGRMDNPSAVVIYDQLKFFVDKVNCAIRYNRSGSTALETFAGTKDIGFADGIGTAASFDLPLGMVRVGGDLYVTDTRNHTIRKIRIATRRVSTFVGTAQQSGFADGIGAAARFDNPNEITTDGLNLFVIDVGNKAIRKINTTTAEVSTLVGGSAGYVDGAGDIARLDSPIGIQYLNNVLYFNDISLDTVTGFTTWRLRSIR